MKKKRGGRRREDEEEENSRYEPPLNIETRFATAATDLVRPLPSWLESPIVKYWWAFSLGKCRAWEPPYLLHVFYSATENSQGSTRCQETCLLLDWGRQMHWRQLSGCLGSCVPKSSCRRAGDQELRGHESCLLLKFVHKLHEADHLPWKTWFISHAGANFLNAPDSYLAKLVLTELPRYRSLTKVQLGDGTSVSFWHDKWLTDTTIACMFPALHSHNVDDAVSVHSVIEKGVRQHLRP